MPREYQPEELSGDPMLVRDTLRQPDPTSCWCCGAPITPEGEYNEPSGHNLDEFLARLWGEVACRGPTALFVLLARAIGGMTFVEIGEALGVSSMAACKSALRLARKFPTLRPQLSKAPPKVQRAAQLRRGARLVGGRFVKPAPPSSP